MLRMTRRTISLPTAIKIQDTVEGLPFIGSKLTTEIAGDEVNVKVPLGVLAWLPFQFNGELCLLNKERVNSNL